VLSIKCEISLLNDTKRQVLYDNENNQGLCNNCLKKVFFKNLGIKLCSITIGLYLIIILPELLAYKLIGLAYSLLN
jgi:hypothetical protein